MPLATESESSEVLRNSPTEKAALGDAIASHSSSLPWEGTEILPLESGAQPQRSGWEDWLFGVSWVFPHTLTLSGFQTLCCKVKKDPFSNKTYLELQQRR